METTRQLIIAPDPILNQVAKPVEETEEGIRTLIDNIFKVMRTENGVGLTAVHIGVLKRIIVLDFSESIEGEHPRVFINPKLTYSSQETWEAEEGSLSFPKKKFNITRPQTIEVEYLDQNWKPQILRASGWLARGFLHELDQLNGITVENAAKDNLKNKMAKRRVIIAPDPRLNTVAEPIKTIDESIRRLISDMFEIMQAAKGAGLAATQIGINKRLFIMDLSSYIEEEIKPYVIINPEITYCSEETWIAEEGCLSFPEIKKISITRPENIKMKYLDEKGEQKEMQASGWLARCIQHETDHINGITMVHYVSKIKRDMILKKLMKLKKNNEV
jgi:peptide deformylase